MSECLRHNCNKHVHENSREQEVANDEKRPNQYLIWTITVIVSEEFSNHDEVHSNDCICRSIISVLIYVRMFIPIQTDDVEDSNESSHYYKYDNEEFEHIFQGFHNQFDKISSFCKYSQPVKHFDPKKEKCDTSDCSNKTNLIIG